MSGAPNPGALSLTIHHGAPHLQVDAAGPASLADLCGVADLLATICARQGYLQLGAYVAQQLRALERVASIVPERYRTGTSEKAAQKAGLQLRTFTSLEEGLAWVRAGPEDDPRPGRPPQ